MIQKLEEEGRRGRMWVRDDEREYRHHGEQREADSRDRLQSRGRQTKDKMRHASQ